jgi:hypothetical protein
MTIDFGGIKSYDPNRGFGFVSRTFLNPNGKVFFHIKKIKREHSELAQRLEDSGAFESVNFWYEIEITEKGEQVGRLWLNAAKIPQTYASELGGFVRKVESIWEKISSPKPIWLDLVTIDLVGVDRRHELSVERDNWENQLKAAEEKRFREAQTEREWEKQFEVAEEARLKEAQTLQENESGRIANEHRLTKLEADELHQLLLEMRPLNFTRSRELSAYIVKQQLGYKYPNISGIVRMEEAGTQWDFHGGFPPDIYKVICKELELNNQGTDARAIKFTPFKNIY